MNFGEISNFIIIGGSSTVMVACRQIRSLGYPVTVFSGDRLLEESIGETTLRTALEAEAFEYRSVEDIHQCPELESLITAGTFAFSIGSPWIFGASLLKRLESRFVNIHPVSIPKMDGGAHFSWQILMNNRIGATTIQMVRKGLNRGELIKVDEYSFSSRARIPADYFRESLQHIHQTTERFLTSLHRRDDFEALPVDLRFRTFYPRLYTASHGYIDWNMTAEELERFICAFDDPYSGAMTYMDGKRMHLKDAYVDSSEGTFHPFMRGIIHKKRDGCLHIVCRGGTLLVHCVTDDAGQNCLVEAGIGKRFFTPTAVLEKALGYEAVFDAKGIVDPSKEG